MVCHHLAIFGSHRHCSSRDMFSACHASLIKQDDLIKVSDGYNNRSPSRLVTILSSLVAIGTVIKKI